MNVNKNIPVFFQKLTAYEDEDTRFIKVKIWLMHLGENLNGSYFDKNVVTSALPTLSNTPILAYIEQNQDGDNDFSDHRQVLTIEDGEFKLKYLCQAIGIIPETNNAKFEFRVCDDGIEREFLTVEGLVWQKWDEPIDIFNRDAIKNQSMEIHSDYEGSFQEDKLFHFTKISFFGACCLGKYVSPAMRSASIEMQFSHESMFDDIQEKMEQFKTFQNQTNENFNIVKKVKVNNPIEKWECPHCTNFIGEKELFYELETQKWFHRPCYENGEIVFSPTEEENEYFTELKRQGEEKVNEKLEMFAKFPTLKEEDVASLKANIEQYTLEELELKLNELFTAQQNPESKEEDAPQSAFSLTSQQLKDELRMKLAEFQHVDRWGDSCRQYWYLDHDDSRVYAEDGQNGYLPVGINYSLNGDVATLDIESKKRIKWVPQDLEDGANSIVTLMSIERSETDFNKVNEKFQTSEQESQTKYTEIEKQLEGKAEELSTLQSQFETIKSQYEEISEKYSSKIEKETEQKFNVLFESFAKELSSDEILEVKNLKETSTYEEIETKLFALVGKKKAKFSHESNKKPIIDLEVDKTPKKKTGKSYDELFEKYSE